MGSGDSSLNIPGGGSEGYHVLKIQENSPGHVAGLEPFFDFIIAINGIRLDQDNNTLKDTLVANVEKPVKLLVYSSKTMNLKEVTLVPTNKWGGQGVLGVSIRFCSFEKANENVWHVLDVQPHSPAALAGLRSNSDYIIGSDQLLTEPEDLFTLIESFENRQLKLYVYNCELDNVREVLLTPNCAWGGEGSLGCDIGYGYLHRIPVQSEKSTSTKVKVQQTPTNSLLLNLNQPQNPLNMPQLANTMSNLSLTNQNIVPNEQLIIPPPSIPIINTPPAPPTTTTTLTINQENPTFSSTFGDIKQTASSTLLEQAPTQQAPQQLTGPQRYFTPINSSITDEQLKYQEFLARSAQQTSIQNDNMYAASGVPTFVPKPLNNDPNDLVQSLVKQTIMNHQQHLQQQ